LNLIKGQNRAARGTRWLEDLFDRESQWTPRI